MTDEERNDSQSLLDKLIAVLSGLPWLDVLGEVWKIVRKVIQARSYRGMYDVLEYESTLVLKDRGGKRATFKKREKVRYLLDNVIAHRFGCLPRSDPVVQDQMARSSWIAHIDCKSAAC